MRSAEKQADILKNKGNDYFKKEKLGAAIDAYTEAITLCPSVPVYWLNRAICEKKRNEWAKVEADCRRALELDSHSFKAYYFLGLALLQYQQYEEAVKQLEKALDLNRGKGVGTTTYMVEEIWQELAKARLAEWEAVADIRERRQLDLKTYLSRLLKDDYERQLKEAVAGIKAAAADGIDNDTLGGTKGKKFSQVEVDDLIRFDSGSKKGSDRNISGSAQNKSDSEISAVQAAESEISSRRYGKPSKSDGSNRATYSEGTGEQTSFDPLKQHKLSLGRSRRGSRNSLVHSEDSGEQTSFDPLKQHKLSLGRSRRGSRDSSVRRQGSEPGPVDAPDVTTGTQGTPSPAYKEDLSSAGFAGMKLDDIQRAGTPAPPKTESEVLGVNSGSIQDVFKVFKEFMKLRQNEAGQKLLRISEHYQRRSKVMDDVFDRVAAPDRQVDIPDHLCCKITMDIFRDPVLTPSGITYERAAIIDHIRKVGKFDPFTRAHLTEEQVFPNLAIKEAVQVYLDEHGWAYGPG